MKIIEKIKKGLIGIGAVLLTLPTKVFAAGMDIERTPLLYGIQEPDSAPESLMLKNILNICRIAVIPIALIIGIIIYLKKSKSSKKKKILVTIGIIVITAILYFVLDKIIYEIA